MKFYLRKLLINFLVKHLFNGITDDDILKVLPNGNVIYRGKPLKEEIIVQIRDEAERFHNSALWKVLSKEVKYRANQRMFEKGMSESDMFVGKSILYTIDVIESKLNNLKRLR
jgi:hypothetical protein